MEVTFPPWENLTAEQRARINNGVGPDWMPKAVRAALTRWSSWFFEEASWAHHDYGYFKGRTPVDRFRCDWLFLQAMQRDASKLPLLRRTSGIILSRIYYGFVRLFGWLSFNNSGHQTLPEWLKGTTHD